MPTTRTFNRSFAGGEISPEMFGRIDDAKFQTGAARLRNFVSRPQGPAENRAGFMFVNSNKNAVYKSRIVPFTYSTTQTMVVELGQQYIRFHTMGATLQQGSPAAYNGATTYAIGDMVSSGGTNYYCVAATTGNAPPNATYWYAQPATGEYEIPSPYAATDIFDIHHVQSADILTFVHPSYAPKELRRLGATKWTLTDISFTADITAPTNAAATTAGVTTTKYNYSYVVTAVKSDLLSESAPSATALGVAVAISAITKANPGEITTTAVHNLVVGDKIYISGVGGMTQLNGNYYIVNTVPSTTKITLKTLTGTVVDTTSYGTFTSGGNVYPAFIKSNLLETGCTNTITWTAVANASIYKIYKFQGGVYGYIGQSSSTTFVDDNITPDLGVTPPTYDTVFNSSGNYPAAVSYFEQRRCLAGTNNDPQTIWMTKSGTESNMSYGLPIKDDDRIKFRVAAREANTIRHIVPLTQLILLTSAAEWRVTSVNSDAITPTTISVRPQSYIGASNVQPVIINNSLVYCAARGGHVRELGYSWQSNGFITGDVSVRAAHLFDGYEITDMCYGKAPNPLVYFVQDNGLLLGLTYVPDQQIGAWHWHDTDGLFESCTIVAEGTEDVLYVVVKRTINGTTKRYIERQHSRNVDLTDAFFVDSGLQYVGTNTGSTTVTVTGGSTWGPADLLTVTSSVAIFQAPPVTTDVDDAIVITGSDGTMYRLKIKSTTSTTVATCQVDKVIPAALRGVATTVWSFARNSVSGLSHLEGKTVSILADGAVQPQQVVTSGSVSIPRAASLITVGLPYVSDLQTLPLALNVDAFGQGRYKNINKAWLRVFKSSGIFVGPNQDNLVEAKQRTTEPYGSPPALKSDEIQVMMTPTWAAGGQVFVRQVDPLPLTVVGMTLEVTVGG